MQRESRMDFAAKQGADLRAKREAAGLTQLDLANELGVSPAAVSTWERGGAVMSSQTAERVRAWFQGREKAA